MHVDTPALIGILCTGACGGMLGACGGMLEHVVVCIRSMTSGHINMVKDGNSFKTYFQWRKLIQMM